MICQSCGRKADHGESYCPACHNPILASAIEKDEQFDAEVAALRSTRSPLRVVVGFMPVAAVLLLFSDGAQEAMRQHSEVVRFVPLLAPVAAGAAAFFAKDARTRAGLVLLAFISAFGATIPFW